MSRVIDAAGALLDIVAEPELFINDRSMSGNYAKTITLDGATYAKYHLTLACSGQRFAMAAPAGVSIALKTSEISGAGVAHTTTSIAQNSEMQLIATSAMQDSEFSMTMDLVQVRGPLWYGHMISMTKTATRTDLVTIVGDSFSLRGNNGAKFSLTGLRYRKPNAPGSTPPPLSTGTLITSQVKRTPGAATLNWEASGAVLFLNVMPAGYTAATLANRRVELVYQGTNLGAVTLFNGGNNVLNATLDARLAGILGPALDTASLDFYLMP